MPLGAQPRSCSRGGVALLGQRHEGDWQEPAITERRAFEMVRAARLDAEDTTYFAFPWATLIDRITSRHADEGPLLERLAQLARSRRRVGRVITVCQHVRMMEFRHLFDQLRITDVFWSHAMRGRPRWGGNRSMRIHPFPLYPVQAPAVQTFRDDERRPLLFNFVGAVENSWYLTDVRRWIVDALSGHPRGLIVPREAWHYQRAVYEHQIKGVVAEGAALTDAAAEAEFATALKQSTFTLCPSGSGPNSIRLWESIGHGSIPVILSDTLALPGPAQLWREAAVLCEETEEAVRGLPALLQEIEADPAQLRTRRRALRQLWLLYGPLNFIHDIRALALTPTASGSAPAVGSPRVGPTKPKVCLFGRHGHRTPMSYPAYRPLFSASFDYVDDPSRADILVLGFEIDIRDNIETLAQLKAANPGLHIVVLSEEPLWDTVWSAQLRPRQGVMRRGGHEVAFQRLNHANTDIFDFAEVPYFLTTDDQFFARYGALFSRNARRPAEHFRAIWERAPVRAAFMAEKRDKKVYDVRFPEAGVEGLSAYRTRLAEAVQGSGVLRGGKGWEEGEFRRQDLADWHLDKLATLDGRAFIISAIENTHQRQYVTEKLFDALAARGFPIFHAALNHRVHDLVGGACLNTFGLSVEEAAERIQSLSPSDICMDSYLAAQNRLARLFASPARLSAERSRVTQAVGGELRRILDTTFQVSLEKELTPVYTPPR